jgi:hypothetical protein
VKAAMVILRFMVPPESVMTTPWPADAEGSLKAPEDHFRCDTGEWTPCVC